jgi:tetratricopeptide (TPR) repeat protein
MAGIVLLPALVLAWPLAAQQQSSSPPPAQQDQSAPNAPAPQKSAQQASQAKKKPSEAEQNPFPEAQSQGAARQAQQQQDSAPSAPAPQQDQSTPNAPAPQNGKPSTADQNPFPESQSENAQRSQEQSESEKSGQDNGQSGSRKPAAPPGPGKSPDDYSSSHLKLSDLPGDNDAADPGASGVNGHNPALATKDTQVGMFYLKTGDYKGAYDRFAEATKADPGNADAVFGLAESARRLNLRDEAVRNYRLYLAAVPDGPRAKDSRKALKEMGVSPNS